MRIVRCIIAYSFLDANFCARHFFFLKRRNKTNSETTSYPHKNNNNNRKIEKYKNTETEHPNNSKHLYQYGFVECKNKQYKLVEISLRKKNPCRSKQKHCQTQIHEISFRIRVDVFSHPKDWKQLKKKTSSSANTDRDKKKLTIFYDIHQCEKRSEWVSA